MWPLWRKALTRRYYGVNTGFTPFVPHSIFTGGLDHPHVSATITCNPTVGDWARPGSKGVFWGCNLRQLPMQNAPKQMICTPCTPRAEHNMCRQSPWSSPVHRSSLGVAHVTPTPTATDTCAAALSDELDTRLRF